MNTQMDMLEDESNPLDCVEDVLNANNWVFSRMTQDELVVSVSGKCGQYRLFFIWQDDMQALQFCVHYAITIQHNNLEATRRQIGLINENMWMGHFDIPATTAIPTYRYTCLLRGMSAPAFSDTVQDIVDISMAQCERYFPIFQLLASANDVCEKSLSLALMDTAGES